MIMADFDSFVKSQAEASRCYNDNEEWTRKSIINVASMGKFSSDRAIQEYAKGIWNIKATDVSLDK